MKLKQSCICGVLLAQAMFGQGLTGSISGTVTDPTGSAVPGADVLLTNIQTSQTRQVKAQQDGDFVFAQLLPGTFRLQVSASGFGSMSRIRSF